jgi:hypothetical protein
MCVYLDIVYSHVPVFFLLWRHFISDLIFVCAIFFFTTNLNHPGFNQNMLHQNIPIYCVH